MRSPPTGVPGVNLLDPDDVAMTDDFNEIEEKILNTYETLSTCHTLDIRHLLSTKSSQHSQSQPLAQKDMEAARLVAQQKEKKPSPC